MLVTASRMACKLTSYALYSTQLQSGIYCAKLTSNLQRCSLGVTDINLKPCFSLTDLNINFVLSRVHAAGRDSWVPTRLPACIVISHANELTILRSYRSR